MIFAVRMPVAVVARTLRESRSGTGVACTAERNAARAASSPCSSAYWRGRSQRQELPQRGRRVVASVEQTVGYRTGEGGGAALPATS